MGIGYDCSPLDHRTLEQRQADMQRAVNMFIESVNMAQLHHAGPRQELNPCESAQYPAALRYTPGTKAADVQHIDEQPTAADAPATNAATPPEATKPSEPQSSNKIQSVSHANSHHQRSLTTTHTDATNSSLSV